MSSLFHRRPLLLVACAAFLGGACSQEPVSSGPTRDAVIAAYVDAGYSQAVAECVVGIGERRTELAALMPSDDPAASTRLVLDSCVDAEALKEGNEPVEQLAFSDEPQGYGDDDHLDDLWDKCEGGDGKACDDLWEESPVGSEYERFGITCGDRVDILHCEEEMNGTGDSDGDADGADPGDSDDAGDSDESGTDDSN